MFSFLNDLKIQQPIERAMAVKLDAEKTVGKNYADLILPSGKTVEMKTEIGYMWEKARNFYFEVCDVKKGDVAPVDVWEVIFSSKHKTTGIFRAHAEKIDYWLHGFPNRDGLSYFMFSVPYLFRKVTETMDGKFRGNGQDNGRWQTLGFTLPKWTVVQWACDFVHLTNTDIEGKVVS